MAKWYNFFNRKTAPNTQFAERDDSSAWLMYFKQFGADLSNIECYSRENAFKFAKVLPEVFFPIDYIADACAGLEYKAVYSDTLEEYSGLTRNQERLLNKPNPYQKLSDLVYDGVFAKLADGNTYDVVKIPDGYKNATPDNVTNVWTLSPEVTYPVLKKEIPNPLGIKDSSELVDAYNSFYITKLVLEPKYVYHHVASQIGTDGRANSLLSVVEKNINNLLQVYSARYNVFAKALNAGILSYDGMSSTDLSAQLSDPVTRDAILKDINNRNGLTGDKNFIGVTNIPLKFIKTIASISELQPFDETEADAIAIAGIFGIPSSIVPKRAEPKYSNGADSERKVWQNIIIPYAIERGEELAKAFQLPDGVVLYPDFSTIEILQDDKKVRYDADSVLIDNLTKLKGEGLDVTEAFKKLQDNYNTNEL